MYKTYIILSLVLFGCGYLSYQSVIGSLDISPLKYTDYEVSNAVDNLSINNSFPDMIATKMKFKQDKFFGYGLKDYAFVVSNNSRICPEQNCKFEFEKTNLSPTSGVSGYAFSGTIKLDIGDVKKILGIYSDFRPTEEREVNKDIIEIVEGTLRIGKEPVNNAEYTYNVNGTLVTSGKDQILSLQGVQCNGLQDDPNKPIDCNY